MAINLPPSRLFAGKLNCHSKSDHLIMPVAPSGLEASFQSTILYVSSLKQGQDIFYITRSANLCKVSSLSEQRLL